MLSFHIYILHHSKSYRLDVHIILLYRQIAIVLCYSMHHIDILYCICNYIEKYEEIQKKTFTKWAQSHLCKATGQVPKFEDLYTDLRDGCVLLKLLEILSGENLVSVYVCMCKYTYTYVLYVCMVCMYTTKYSQILSNSSIRTTSPNTT